MTNNLHRRVFQHKTQEGEGFSGAYDAVRLVYWESTDDVHKTIAREKQLKNWRREKKLWLIARMNPKFQDLAADCTPAKISRPKAPKINCHPERSRGTLRFPPCIPRFFDGRDSFLARRAKNARSLDYARDD
ncbi:MAG: GIY-YIG nuclease family protein, partial [Terriglobales bacterium]